MEELDDENNAIVNEDTRKIPIKTSKIIKKFRDIKIENYFVKN